MDDKVENISLEDEIPEALVNYDSDSSMITVIESDSADGEKREKEKKTESTGAIPKKKLPVVTENIEVTKAWVENLPMLPIGSRMIYEKQEKLVTKMENSMKLMDKIMSKATDMMENMVEVTRLNLERERVKLRSLELEAEKKNEKVEKIDKPEIRAQRATIEETKCFSCNKLGHMAKDCPLAEHGAWFCYYCQEVRGHKGDSCPNSGKEANRFRGKR
ncbi:uncharacterized protein LOC120357207 [Solenopsis invicta]|uniref:uncharacterized protein LOC120357207 n=1 Tax=Solenopsis invicta TaxID=13686 RepID=UPI00193C8D8F|nr:uncharacterized protein LOC120357207 [Solenopsis invicta]